MSATEQGGLLARTHEGEPGLPRGRTGLPAEEVRAAQRERLLRAVIAAVARAGYGELTVADIVRGARVSKAAFYAHFSGKEDCFLAAEPAFARAFYIDMPAAGARAVRRIEAAQHNFARLNRAWHERARHDHPDWPAVPYLAYYALTGATTELIRAEVRQDKIGTIPGLADPLVALHLAVLAGQSWQSPG